MRWMWIDQIVVYEAGRRMAAVKNVSLAEEHLHDHFPATASEPAAPVMPATLMIEGMAQTAGILVGSINRFREKVILAKIILARFDEDVFPGDTIRYDASIERVDPQGASTAGTVQVRRAGGETWRDVGRVDLMFSHLDQNMLGAAFPKENFVFSENFRTILRSAGLDDLAKA